VSVHLKLLVDVGVGKAVENWLKTQGHDVLAVRDLDPRMPDLNILALAVREQRLVVTMDKDFGELVYRSRQPHAGVLLLRLEEARSDEKVAVVNEILRKYEKQVSGNFSVYQGGRLRIRTT
jgi:predicted nuclease of predicted toxin-antitoxin system